MATFARIRSTRLLVLGLVLASLVTITVDARGGESGPLAGIGRVGLAIITPLQKGVAAVVEPIAGFFSNMFRAGALAEENEILRQQMAAFSEELALAAENEALIDQYERLLGVLDEAGLSERITARVIAYSPSNFEWGIEVDRGSADGVVDDMAVVGPEGLVGRVIEVGPSSSIARLIVDPDSDVTARLSTSRETGILSGQGEGDLVLELFDPDIRVEPGEIVVTGTYRLDSGEEGLFPAGIRIGQVSEVLSDQGAREIFVRPFVDFTALETVALVQPVEAPPVEPTQTDAP